MATSGRRQTRLCGGLGDSQSLEEAVARAPGVRSESERSCRGGGKRRRTVLSLARARRRTLSVPSLAGSSISLSKPSLTLLDTSRRDRPEPRVNRTLNPSPCACSTPTRRRPALSSPPAHVPHRRRSLRAYRVRLERERRRHEEAERRVGRVRTSAADESPTSRSAVLLAVMGSHKVLGAAGRAAVASGGGAEGEEGACVRGGDENAAALCGLGVAWEGVGRLRGAQVGSCRARAGARESPRGGERKACEREEGGERRGQPTRSTPQQPGSRSALSLS